MGYALKFVALYWLKNKFFLYNNTETKVHQSKIILVCVAVRLKNVNSAIFVCTITLIENSRLFFL